MTVASRRRLLYAGLLLALILGAVAAVVEHFLEIRDVSRLTADATFYIEGDRRVRFHRTGTDTSGPTVVLLNGMMASLEQWDTVQTALGPTTPVLSYDRGGNGFSDAAHGYGAEADSDELNQLLESHEFPPPFVLVSFSSSSMLATVFTARHPALVKGIVFVDPTVRLGAKTYHRIYWRPAIVNPLMASLGYTRLKLAIANRGAMVTPAFERWNAVLASTHHWIASSKDVMSLDESADAVDAALATHPFTEVHVGVLATLDPDANSYYRDYFERQRRLAESSRYRIFRVIHGTHNFLLDDSDSVAQIVDLIRTVTAEVSSARDLAVGRPK